MPVHENSLAASVPFDFDAIDEALAPSKDPNPANDMTDRFEFGRRVLSYIRSKDRARLTTDCLFLALGDAELDNETMTSVAKRHGITKAAVSKRTKEARSDLHLPVNQNNKSADAVKKYQNNRSPICLARTA